jgi:hypothetical protein
VNILQPEKTANGNLKFFGLDLGVLPFMGAVKITINDGGKQK